MRKVLKFFCFLTIFFVSLVYLVVGFNTYGTSDVALWLSWAQAFVASGFWQNFLPLSDIPLINTGIVYLSGLLTQAAFQTVTPATFPGVFKAVMLPLLVATALIAKQLTGKWLAAILILVNPAIFLNFSVLGFMDVVFIFCYFLGLWLLQKRIKGNLSKILPFAFSVVLILGFLTKPQWILFFPVLAVFGLLVFYQHSLYKPYLAGFLAGGLIFVLTLSVGTHSPREFLHRVDAVRVTYTRTVGGQIFVVANFPNF